MDEFGCGTLLGFILGSALTLVAFSFSNCTVSSRGGRHERPYPNQTCDKDLKLIDGLCVNTARQVEKQSQQLKIIASVAQWTE